MAAASAADAGLIAKSFAIQQMVLPGFGPRHHGRATTAIVSAGDSHVPSWDMTTLLPARFRHSPHRLIAVCVLVAATLAVAACKRAAAPPPPPVSADTWAVVDGRTISREMVEKAYQRTQDTTTRPLSDEEAMTAKLNVLNDVIVQDILLAKAAQLKLTIADSELDTAYADAKKNIADEAFQQELTRRGLSVADMREGLRREILAQKVVAQEVGAKIAVTDKDVNDFFSANRGQFNVPEEAYHIAQIVVTPIRDPQIANRSGDDATSPEAATAKVQMLMERLKAGAAFGELAAGYSEDPESAPRGGDMGLVPVSRLRQAPPALRDAVMNKAPGTVTVVSAGGAHTIVLVVAHEAAGQRDPSMPEIRQQIVDALRGRKEQLLRAAYLTAARSDAQVVNYLARRLVDSQGKPSGLQPAAPGVKQP
jgi:peptidyl-prolyl cis-trans isomerase SurA